MINSTPAFHIYVNIVKNTIIDNVISQNTYLAIVLRYTFYLYNTGYIQVPNEGLCEKIIRKLFTRRPHPYHYDFSLKNPTSECVDTLLLELRHSYGYADRKSTLTDRSAIYSTNYLNTSGKISSISLISSK